MNMIYEKPSIKKSISPLSKCVLLMLIALPLQGCFTLFFTYSYFHFKYDVNLAAYGITLGGTLENIQRYNLKILVDSLDVSDVFGEPDVCLEKKCFPKSYRDKYPEISQEELVEMRAGVGYCNSSYGGGDIYGCNRNIDHDVVVTAILSDSIQGKSVILDQRILTTEKHRMMSSLVKMYLVKDREKYRDLNRGNPFSFDSAKAVLFPGFQDSIYIYKTVEISDEDW
ncbi:MAG: hypothetical protein MJZ05_06955 [Fibrobacter sp.]|nr:hypothetical protein [Fibrobacter sp.]